MKKNRLIHQTPIGINHGDKKHAICALCKDGEFLQEFIIGHEPTLEVGSMKVTVTV